MNGAWKITDAPQLTRAVSRTISTALALIPGNSIAPLSWTTCTAGTSRSAVVIASTDRDQGKPRTSWSVKTSLIRSAAVLPSAARVSVFGASLEATTTHRSSPKR